MPPTRMAYRRHASSAVPILASLSKLFTLASPTNLRAGHEYLMAEGRGDEPEDKPDSPVFWWKLGFSACLVLAGGVFAGYVFFSCYKEREGADFRLTLALMGSDDLNLRVLATSSDDPAERKQAGKVLKLLAKGRHWVLVVLLLSNVVRHPLFTLSRTNDRSSMSLYLFSWMMFSEEVSGQS
jgi:metal transporter CNNM